MCIIMDLAGSLLLVFQLFEFFFLPIINRVVVSIFLYISYFPGKFCKWYSWVTVSLLAVTTRQPF